MVEKKKVYLRYSAAFRLKVVEEIEDGKLTKNEAGKLYGIKGAHTIEKWIDKLGKNHLLNRVVRVEKTDEINKLKKAEKEKKELESALAQAHLKIQSLENMLEIARREYGIDLKKK